MNFQNGDSRNHQIATALRNLREKPVDSESLSEEILKAIYLYLLPSNSEEISPIHWFCERAGDTTREAAVFLLRLLAYSGQHVEVWKKRLSCCLSSCPQCVQAFESAKIESRSTYLGCYPENILDEFFASFSAWEATSVVEELSKLQGLPTTSQQQSFTDFPSSLIYRIVASPSLLSDSRILSFVLPGKQMRLFTDWPHGKFLPGLVLLAVHEDSWIRDWATKQLLNSTQHPAPIQAFLPGSCAAVKNLFSLADSMGSTIHSNSTDPVVPWTSLLRLLPIFPDEILLRHNTIHLDIRLVAASHLHDNGPAFEAILLLFIALQNRFSGRFWDEGGPDPRIVFDAVKDNQSFLELIQSTNTSTTPSIPWCLNWLMDYIAVLRKHATYPDVLAKVNRFLFEELQHERFDDVRPIGMHLAAKLLKEEAVRCTVPANKATIYDLLDIHADVFIAVTFQETYADPQWSIARKACRLLFRHIALDSIEAINLSIYALCEQLSTINKGKTLKENSIVFPLVKNDLWFKAMNTIAPGDCEGIADMVTIISRCAHLAFLHPAAFRASTSGKAADTSLLQGIETVNRALKTFSTGFLPAVTLFIDAASSSTGLELISRPGVAKAIVILMLSPVGELQAGAQALVGLAFDVDVRFECFRALLENLPDASIQGIFEFLKIFTDFAAKVPEACSLSKSLVRCFTDIIEILCATPAGLLHHDRFLRSADRNGPSRQLLTLWNLMAKAITVIFKRTPSWSVYFESSGMVEWMRDALIFARDMLAQRQVIEAAIRSSQESSSVSAVRKPMIQDLQAPLLELTRWLRLTNEELLHQSFSLLQSLLECFRDSDIPPAKTCLERLSKHVSDARKQDKSGLRSRLDESRLSKLESSLSYFDDDEPIEIVSHTRAPPKAKSPKLADARSSSSADASRRTMQPKLPSSSRGFIKKDSLEAEAAPMPVLRPSKAVMPKTQQTLRPISDTSETADTSSSSDSDSDGEGLAALAKLHRSPKIRKPERRQIKTIELPSLKTPRYHFAQEARRKQLKARPNLGGLHQALLSWDYSHTGPTPPGPHLSLRPVPDTFESYDHYRSVFEPLLLLECWSQLLQAKQESQESFPCLVASRSHVDHWLDLDVTISSPIKDWYLTDTDVVLLRSSNGSAAILGKVRTWKLSAQEGVAGLRLFINPKVGDPGLQQGSTWNISKILSLSTLHREYAALMAVQYYDFFDIIIKPKLSARPPVEPGQVHKLMEKYKLNKPQATAIVASLKTDGFSLIQGPPGTGKTMTICGLVATHLFGSTTKSGKNDSPTETKILLCAPSNAAIDEVAKRIKECFPKIFVVRVGNDKSVNTSVKDITLDYLVEKRVPPGEKKDGPNEIQTVKSELDAIKSKRQSKFDELKVTHDNIARTNALHDEIAQLNARRQQLRQQYDRLSDQQKSEFRTLDAARRQARIKIIQEADVVCSTLSGAGHDLLEPFNFSLVIIDEAAQAIELSSLIPLKNQCNRCIMVGDPQQLPPTVLSPEATKFRYNQSLFVRLQKQKPDAVHLLSIQYRMHPEISLLPSQLFYSGRLEDGPDMATKTAKPWHQNPKFGVYRFYNVTSGVEQKAGNSIKNLAECRAILALYSQLIREYPKHDFNFRIGIVSMYRAQLQELRRCFQDRFGNEVLSVVDFNTVDGFQGQEKDVIILSCVRAGTSLQSVGFLSDIRRMNVSLTRAKSSLFVIGHGPTLERSDDDWRKIIANARSRGLLIDQIDANFFSSSLPTTSRIVPIPIKSSVAEHKIQPIPDDLVKPNAFKSSQAAAQTPKEEVRPVNTQAPKRKRSGDVPLNADAKSSEGNSNAAVPLPKQKRPKPPPNIFIPKNKTKPPLK